MIQGKPWHDFLVLMLTKVWPKVDFFIFKSKWDGTFGRNFKILKYTFSDFEVAEKWSIDA